MPLLANRHAINDDADSGRPHAPKFVSSSQTDAARGSFGSQHKNRGIAECGDHAGIGDGHDRRRINDDAVVSFAKLVEQVRKEPIVQELDRVSRQRAARQ